MDDKLSSLENKISELEKRLAWLAPTLRVLSVLAFFVIVVHISRFIVENL